MAIGYVQHVFVCIRFYSFIQYTLFFLHFLKSEINKTDKHNSEGVILQWQHTTVIYILYSGYPESPELFSPELFFFII